MLFQERLALGTGQPDPEDQATERPPRILRDGIENPEEAPRLLDLDDRVDDRILGASVASLVMALVAPS